MGASIVAGGSSQLVDAKVTFGGFHDRCFPRMGPDVVSVFRQGRAGHEVSLAVAYLDHLDVIVGAIVRAG